MSFTKELLPIAITYLDGPRCSDYYAAKTEEVEVRGQPSCLQMSVPQMFTKRPLGPVDVVPASRP